MDFSDPHQFAVFFDVHKDLPREGSLTGRLISIPTRSPGDFVLPESAWWDDYYGPMNTRLKMLVEKYADDLTALSVIDECFLEINLYEKYSDYYSYAFLVASI